jgi:hypothetical protein
MTEAVAVQLIIAAMQLAPSIAAGIQVANMPGLTPDQIAALQKQRDESINQYAAAIERKD